MKSKEKSTKVVIITSNLTEIGGTEKVASYIANGLVEELNYDVEIINIGKRIGEEKYRINSDINIKYVGIEHKHSNNKIKLIINLFNMYIKLKKFIKLQSKRNESVIIGIGTGISYLLPYVYNNKYKLIGTQHNPVSHNKIVDIFRRLTIKKMDHYVVLDKDTKNDMENNCKLKGINVIPNPLTIKINEKSKLNSKTVLAVGRLTKQKGFDLLLESWKIVASEHNDWNLVIVGEGEEYESLNNKIKSIGIEASVSIKPFTREIQEHYKNSSIFVLSSRYEGFGLVVLEAQAFGLPVVAFDCPTGPRNIINDGVDGYLVENENIEELSEKISMLIKDKNIRSEVGQNAIKNSDRFKIENIINKWENLINSNI